jgi:hypothetical protein
VGQEPRRERASPSEASKATTAMADVHAKEARVLEDQAALSLFTIPADMVLSEDALQYVQLRKKKEMTHFQLPQCEAMRKVKLKLPLQLRHL